MVQQMDIKIELYYVCPCSKYHLGYTKSWIIQHYGLWICQWNFVGPNLPLVLWVPFSACPASFEVKNKVRKNPCTCVASIMHMLIHFITYFVVFLRCRNLCAVPPAHRSLCWHCHSRRPARLLRGHDTPSVRCHPIVHSR